MKYIFLFFLAIILLNSPSRASISYKDLYLTGDEALPGDEYLLPSKKDQLVSDPLETPNRIIFSFNLAVDYMLLRPVSYVYGQAIPPEGRRHVSAFFHNLSTPVTFANDILQGDFMKAQTSFWRFIINTILGGFGVMDVAADFGLPYHKEDFGRTMSKYGIGFGPYLVLPLFGSTTIKDAFGRVVDYKMDPFIDRYGKDWMYYTSYVKTIHERREKAHLMDDIVMQSLDPYVTTRSLYIQNRLKSQLKSECFEGYK